MQSLYTHIAKLWKRKVSRGSQCDAHDEERKLSNRMPVELLVHTMTFMHMRDFPSFATVSFDHADAFGDEYLWEQLLARDFSCRMATDTDVAVACSSVDMSGLTQGALINMSTADTSRPPKNICLIMTQVAESVGLTVENVFDGRTARDLYYMLKTRSFTERRFEDMTRRRQAMVVIMCVLLSPFLFMYYSPTIMRWVLSPAAELWEATDEEESSISFKSRGPFRKAYAYFVSILAFPYFLFIHRGPRKGFRSSFLALMLCGKRIEGLWDECVRQPFLDPLYHSIRKYLVAPLERAQRIGVQIEDYIAEELIAKPTRVLIESGVKVARMSMKKVHSLILFLLRSSLAWGKLAYNVGTNAGMSTYSIIRSVVIASYKWLKQQCYATRDSSVAWMKLLDPPLKWCYRKTQLGIGAVTTKLCNGGIYSYHTIGVPLWGGVICAKRVCKKKAQEFSRWVYYNARIVFGAVQRAAVEAFSLMKCNILCPIGKCLRAVCRVLCRIMVFVAKATVTICRNVSIVLYKTFRLVIRVIFSILEAIWRKFLLLCRSIFYLTRCIYFFIKQVLGVCAGLFRTYFLYPLARVIRICWSVVKQLLQFIRTVARGALRGVNFLIVAPTKEMIYFLLRLLFAVVTFFKERILHPIRLFIGAAWRQIKFLAISAKCSTVRGIQRCTQIIVSLAVIMKTSVWNPLVFEIDHVVKFTILPFMSSSVSHMVAALTALHRFSKSGMSYLRVLNVSLQTAMKQSFNSFSQVLGMRNVVKRR